MLTVNSLDHLVLNVRDVEISAAWYAHVLGMTREDHQNAAGGARRTSMRFGRMKINLRPVDASEDEWFTASGCGVEVVTGPVTKRGAMGDILSVYCRDPDGSLIEVSSYPASHP
jgi:catechol 2,3-dioxygenase-like lactoylglutathione lyase family enzyme